MANQEEAQLNGHGADVDLEEDSDEDDLEEDPLAHLPEYVLKRVEKLQDLDAEREKIVENYMKERAELEKKYAVQFKPLYTKRAEIVRGDRDSDSAQSSSPSEEDLPHIKGIPQFWACAMTQMEEIGEMITEEDVDCLEHLIDVQCEDREDGKGFTLYFHFSPNEYFTNSILKKEYDVPNLLLSDEPILKNVRGTEINWKPDKSLTFRSVKKKQRGKGKNAGQIRTVVKKEEKESFFTWFNPPEMPSMDDMDEEEAERLEEVFETDYDVAQAFRHHVIPKAVKWFSGKATEEEMDQLLGGFGN